MTGSQLQIQCLGYVAGVRRPSWLELQQHHNQLEELRNGQQAIFNDIIAKEKPL
jgi:hypothetical protein